METMPTDSAPESLGARRFVEESTTAAGGVEGGERLATMAGESMEMLGAMARATKSSKVEAGAVDVSSAYCSGTPSPPSDYTSTRVLRDDALLLGGGAIGASSSSDHLDIAVLCI